MTMDQINSRLEELRDEKTKIRGLETEVYARIVGYYRSVRNWNKGKKEEYGKRLNFSEVDIDRPSAADAMTVAVPHLSVVDEQATSQQQLSFAASGLPSSYLYFFRKTCPNCSPVAEWLGESGLEGRKIDVDRESGMIEAQRFDITAAPTVVLLSTEGVEMGRGSSVSAIASHFGAVAVAGA